MSPMGLFGTTRLIRRRRYWLATEDAISSGGVYACTDLQKVTIDPSYGDVVYRSTVSPGIITSFQGEPSTKYNSILLSIGFGKDLNDIDDNGIFVDVVVANADGPRLDRMRQCSRIGVGSLYRHEEQARRNSS
jgi:hypothetical protein